MFCTLNGHRPNSSFVSAALTSLIAPMAGTFLSLAIPAKTGALSLTLAAESEINPPPAAYAHRRVSYTGTSPTATEGVFQNHREQPVFMY